MVFEVVKKQLVLGVDMLLLIPSKFYRPPFNLKPLPIFAIYYL